MRDRYNLNLLPGMSEDGVEYGEPRRTQRRRPAGDIIHSHLVFASLSDDVEPNSMASIPGMGIPEQLKAAMEQEQSSKCETSFKAFGGMC